MSRTVSTISPCPVLNTPGFTEVFSSPLPLDEQGLLRPVEWIALPNTLFFVENEIDEHILQVRSDEYDHFPLYIDRRFTKPGGSQRTRKLPEKQTILDKLANSIDLPYIWGGNWGKGIPELLTYYPGDQEEIRSLQGVDCSGLLYEATGGFTPRNTANLLHFGKTVATKSDSAKKILSLIQPLDLIIWPGHVIIVFSYEKTIQSRVGHGVFFEETETTLNKISSLNSYFIKRIS